MNYSVPANLLDRVLLLHKMVEDYVVSGSHATDEQILFEIAAIREDFKSIAINAGSKKGAV